MTLNCLGWLCGLCFPLPRTIVALLPVPHRRTWQEAAVSRWREPQRAFLTHLIEEGEFLQCAVLPHSSNGQVFVTSELHLLLRRETLGLMVCPHHKDQGCMEPGEASM